MKLPDLRPKYGMRGTVGPAKGFGWNEVRCTDGSLPSDYQSRKRFRKQAKHLNQLRAAIKKEYGGQRVAIIVNSWYRSPAYNKKIGGAQFSQHVLCRATDIRVIVGHKEIPPRVVAQLAKCVKAFSNGGIGTYAGFTHVDHRPDGPARWVG